MSIEHLPLAAPLPRNHPDRLALADEVHARPPEAVLTPAWVTFVALTVSPGDRGSELAHISDLCRRFGAVEPTAHAVHFVVDLDRVRLRWERHGEFSSLTFFSGHQSTSDAPESPLLVLPEHWLPQFPGETVFAAHAAIEPLGDGEEEPEPDLLSAHFSGHVVVGSGVGGGAGLAFSDFKVSDDGFSRFLIFNRRFTQRQTGRMLQRLFEIETYRIMALLALPIARAQSARLTRIEASLSRLTNDITGHSFTEEALLQQLTTLATEVEAELAASQFRFGACKAYSELVRRRIAELREQRIAGVQTIEEFMDRRFSPAVATCASTSQRLREISERVSHASSLLSTRVGIASEKQNQLLLASMERRAGLQLRLQQIVEIVSLVPVTYYMTGIVGYLARALSSMGYSINAEIAEGVGLPIIAGAGIFLAYLAHRRAVGDVAPSTIRSASERRPDLLAD
jgi:uncharacterized membrane-anchored protein